MSFREKSLWVMLSAIILATFFYGHAVAYVSHEQFESVPWHAMRVLAPMALTRTDAIRLAVRITVFMIISVGLRTADFFGLVSDPVTWLGE